MTDAAIDPNNLRYSWMPHGYEGVRVTVFSDCLEITVGGFAIRKPFEKWHADSQLLSEEQSAVAFLSKQRDAEADEADHLREYAEQLRIVGCDLARQFDSFASDGVRPDEWLLREWAKKLRDVAALSKNTTESDDNVRTDVAVGGAQPTQAGGDASGMPLSVGRSRPDQTATSTSCSHDATENSRVATANTLGERGTIYESVGFQYRFTDPTGGYGGYLWRSSSEPYNGEEPHGAREIFAIVKEGGNCVNGVGNAADPPESDQGRAQRMQREYQQTGAMKAADVHAVLGDPATGVSLPSQGNSPSLTCNGCGANLRHLPGCVNANVLP